jgi:hypothetical protein
MIDAAAPEHRVCRCASKLPVTSNTFSSVDGADVHKGEPRAVAVCYVLRHRRVEHLSVERMQAGGVVGQNRNVVHAVEQRGDSPFLNGRRCRVGARGRRNDGDDFMLSGARRRGGRRDQLVPAE